VLASSVAASQGTSKWSKFQANEGRPVDSIVVECKRLVLKTFGPADANDVFRCITPQITRFMAWEPPASREAFADVWQSWLSTIEDGTEHYFVVRSRADGRCMGIVGLHALQSQCPELGIWLRADCHGQGFGKEAIEAVIRWASGKLRPDHFEYPVAEQNIASRCIAESLGGLVAERRHNPKYESVVYRIPSIHTASE
jgi:RimJ/RimL family protein N-acetyltransferase